MILQDVAATYGLYIDAFSPETIPMARLAEYMSRFSEILGHEEHVHFEKLKQGSLLLSARIEEVALRKVDRRVDELKYGVAPEAATKAAKSIDEMLAQDNAIGRLLRGGHKIIEFPGRLRPADECIGPVQQTATLDGEVIQVGGRDETINVHLRSANQIFRCIATKELARNLARHLFAGPIRVNGEGTWTRHGNGTWEMRKFVVRSFEVLEEKPLTSLFCELRSRLIPPDEGRLNPIELLRQLRTEE